MNEKRKDLFRKEGKSIFYAASLCGLILLAAWHYLNVKAAVIETGDSFMLSWYIVFAVLGTALLAGTGFFFLIKRKLSIEGFFLTAGLGLGLMFLVILQPLSAPDEIRHFISAYRISDQMMGLPDTNEDGQVYIREQDRFIVDLHPEKGEEEPEILGQLLSQDTYHEIHERSLMGTGEDSLVSSGQIAVQTTPLAYVAPALGITLARLFGLGGIGLLYMGRLFNLILFLGTVWIALRRLPFGKPVMCAAALLPMSLHLAASFSYDTMINGLIFWFGAVCLDLAYTQRNVRKRDILLLAVLIAVVGPCKMVYAPVMGLCLLIPVRKFGGWKNWAAAAAVVLAAWLAAMIIVNSQTITVYTGSTENYIGWAEQTGYTMTELVHRPGLVIQMFYNSLIWQAEYYHLTMIGAYLGQVDQVLDVPYLVVMGLSFCLILLALQRPGEETSYFSVKQRIWIWFLAAAAAGAVMFSMLLAWTPVTSLVISGVQGRYFLPFLPVVLMTLKNRWIICTKNRDKEILFLILWADVFAVLRLFSIVSMRI